MSVIIKGMKMPNGCYYCPILQSSDGCFDFECPFNSYLLWHNAEDVIRYRPDNCPLAEIPTPHGRLIDADRFLDWLKEFHPNDVAIMSGVKNARTVIEAEVSE